MTMKKFENINSPKFNQMEIEKIKYLKGVIHQIHLIATAMVLLVMTVAHAMMVCAMINHY